MTTCEPGASDVLTHGGTDRPRCTALWASRPAASITVGFDVFVQLVIAAITTCPWSTVNVSPSRSTVTAARGRSATSPPRRGRWVGGSGAPIPLAAAPADGGSLAGNDWA